MLNRPYFCQTAQVSLFDALSTSIQVLSAYLLLEACFAYPIKARQGNSSLKGYYMSYIYKQKWRSPEALEIIRAMTAADVGA